jgi:hypothetical protein
MARELIFLLVINECRTIFAVITSGITDTISTSGNIRSNFLKQMCKIVFLLVHF